MQLINFSSWVQLFVGLDLAYAGSKDFRNYISTITIKAKDFVSLFHGIYLSIYRYITKKLTEKIEQAPDGAKYKNTLEKYKEDFEKSNNVVIYHSYLEKDFTNRFKSLFFIGSLGGLMLLFICGIQETDISQVSLLRITYVVNFTIVFYGTFIFVFSLFSSKIDKPVNIFLNIFIITLLIFSALFLFEKIYDIEKVKKFTNLLIVGAVISVALPFALFIIRLFLQYFFSILYLISILVVGCLRLFRITAIIWAHRLLGKSLK